MTFETVGLPRSIFRMTLGCVVLVVADARHFPQLIVIEQSDKNSAQRTEG